MTLKEIQKKERKRSSRFFSADEERLVLKLISKNFPVIDIAKYFKKSTRSIHEVAKRHGVKRMTVEEFLNEQGTNKISTSSR